MKTIRASLMLCGCVDRVIWDTILSKTAQQQPGRFLRLTERAQKKKKKIEWGIRWKKKRHFGNIGESGGPMRHWTKRHYSYLRITQKPARPFLPDMNELQPIKDNETVIAVLANALNVFLRDNDLEYWRDDNEQQGYGSF